MAHRRLVLLASLLALAGAVPPALAWGGWGEPASAYGAYHGYGYGWAPRPRWHAPRRVAHRAAFRRIVVRVPGARGAVTVSVDQRGRVIAAAPYRTPRHSRAYSLVHVARPGFYRAAYRIPARLGWTARIASAGLPHGAQLACPDGTLRVLARGHRDVVRCVPL